MFILFLVTNTLHFCNSSVSCSNISIIYSKTLFFFLIYILLNQMLPLILNSFPLIQKPVHTFGAVCTASSRHFPKNKNWFNANSYLQAIHTYIRWTCSLVQKWFVHCVNLVLSVISDWWILLELLKDFCVQYRQYMLLG